MTEPASIRFNNPGAMWGGNRISKRWGAMANIVLNDGLKQGNTIAYFPSVVNGGAAQFDLWRSSYCNMTLEAAIKKWSGGNSSVPYMNFLYLKTGLSGSVMVTEIMLSGPTGISLLKAQAQWEAGKPYPMTDAQWHEAQEKCFAPRVSVTSKKIATVATGVTTTAAVVINSSQQGASSFQIALIIGAFVAMTAFVFFLIHRSSK